MTRECHRGFGPVIILFALIALLAQPTAGLAADPQGEWLGVVKTPDGKETEIKLALEKLTQSWAARLSDDTIGEVTLSDIMVVGNNISFRYQPQGVPFPAHFLGTYDPKDDRLAGTFSIRGASRFVKFKRISGGDMPAPQQAVPKEPVRIRHDYHFGLSGRIANWSALHVVKDEVYNLNTVTSGTSGLDAAAKVYLQDGFCLFGRYYRGGQSFMDDEAKLGQWPELGISADSYLTLDGWEVGITGFFGNKILKTSKFDPFLTAALGKVTWEVNASGRGSDVLVLERVPLEGTDLSFCGGLGCEYEISQRLQLEFEMLWRYFKTEDAVVWPDPDHNWSNTHTWSYSLGATFGIF